MNSFLDNAQAITALCTLIAAFSYAVVRIVQALRSPDGSDAQSALKIATSINARLTVVEKHLRRCDEDRRQLRIEVEALKAELQGM
ncbi:MAG: hypothetical protein JSR64_17105 [Nitrospira sp.]|nr:hypothetical protein [Nitrospira sp.]